MATFDFSPHGDTPPAPGDLELLQRFLNLHVHDAEGTHLEPPAEQIRGFLDGAAPPLGTGTLHRRRP